MARRKRRRGQGNVELNLAAMLDMAFQLLTFFILTFRPAPVEGHLTMNLPPPVPMTKVQNETIDAGEGTGAASDIETLPMYVRANEAGDVTGITLGTRELVQGALDERNLAVMDQGLRQLFATPLMPFDRIQMSVDKSLRYEELMKIVEVCTRQKGPDGKPMQKISFVEMSE